MKFPYELSATLIGTTIAIVLIQPQMAMANQVVAKIAEEVTVRIDLNGRQAASGVIIAKAESSNIYYVLTAKHAVQSDRNYEIVAHDGKKYGFSVSDVIKIPDVDLAIVPITSSTQYKVGQIGNSDSVSVGQTIYVAGWPLLGSGKPSFQFTDGQISGRTQQSEGYELSYTNTTLAGMSGGPVLDERGQLIAIHGQAEGQEITNPDTGQKIQLTPGINWGIPINTFKQTAPIAYVAMGKEKLKNQNYAGAIADFEQGLWFNPSSADAYVGRGYARFAQKNYRKAIEDATTAIQLNSQLPFAYLLRGAAYAQEGEHQNAIANFDRTIALEPRSAEAYGQRGLSRAQLGDLREANRDAARAIELAPDNPIAYIRRSQIRDLIGEIEAAEADRQKARTLPTPDRSGYQIALIAGSDIASNLTSTRQETLPPNETIQTNNPPRPPLPQSINPPEVSEPPRIATASSGVLTLLNSLNTPSQVMCMAISPNGQMIASGHEDGSIQFWNRNTGESIRILTGHTDAVQSLAFSPDGTLLGSGSKDKTARLWTVQTGRERYAFKEFEQSVYAVTFSPTGSTLITGDQTGEIKLWFTNNGQLYDAFPKNFGAIFSLRVTPDGKTLVSGDQDGDIKFWSLPNGDSLGEFKDVHRSLVYSLSFSRDGKTLVSSDAYGQVKIWDVAAGNLTLRREFVGGYTVFSTAISPDGQTLAIGTEIKDSGTGQVSLWNLADGSSIGMESSSLPVRSLLFSSDGKMLISGGEDVNIWQMP
jgi:WD40 repeat protein